MQDYLPSQERILQLLMEQPVWSWQVSKHTMSTRHLLSDDSRQLRQKHNNYHIKSQLSPVHNLKLYLF